MKEEVFDIWQDGEETKIVNSPIVSTDENGNIKFQGHTSIEKKIPIKYALTKLIPYNICNPDDHYYIIMNNGKRLAGRLEVQCRKCTIGQNFVVGIHTLVNGKIVSK